MAKLNPNEKRKEMELEEFERRHQEEFVPILRQREAEFFERYLAYIEWRRRLGHAEEMDWQS
jgi:hypothetical protein